MLKETKNERGAFSLEIFPPKKEEEFENVYKVLDELSELKPEFISVTYGAGGSRAGKTIEICSYIKKTLGIDTIAHMTCVGSRKDSILEIASQMKSAGIDAVLALRGDRPSYMTDEQFDSREFAHATDLMEFLKANTDLQIAGAAYPEKHPESSCLEDDIKYMLLKQQMGADMLVSQMFFDNNLFYSFLEKADKAGLVIPVCAGIMPITSAKQLGTTVTLSGSSIPKALADIIAKYGDDKDDMRKAGIDYCIRQIRDLNDKGVFDIHLYSMNKPKTTREIAEGIK